MATVTDVAAKQSASANLSNWSLVSTGAVALTTYVATAVSPLLPTNGTGSGLSDVFVRDAYPFVYLNSLIESSRTNVAHVLFIGDSFTIGEGSNGNTNGFPCVSQSNAWNQIRRVRAGQSS